MQNSICKSFLSALYGIYISQGKINIHSTLEDLGIDDIQTLTSQEKKAQVLHLLKSRSGVYHEAASETETMKKLRPVRGSHEPDTFWYYNNWDFNVLESILEQQTGTSVFQAFHEQIAIPLGMENFSLEQTEVMKQEQFSMHAAHHYRMSTRNLARFGMLYLQNGQRGGKQIVPESWVKESTQSYSFMKKWGSDYGYGYLWKVLEGGIFKELGMFEASGSGGQRVSIFRNRGIVIVHRADTDKGDLISGSDILKLYELIVDGLQLNTGE